MFRSKIITKLSFCLVAVFSLSKTEAALLVSEREIMIESQKAWEQMKTSLPVSRDLSKRTQVNCIAKRIIKQLEEPFVDEDWEIEVFENPGVNAFAMPGGKLGVYTGLFSVASNQDELATVIGHEIAHVTEKHSYERAKREMRTRVGTTIGMAVIAGNMANRQIRSQADIYEMNNQINAVNTMSQILSTYGLNLPFNRQQESDADKTELLINCKTNQKINTTKAGNLKTCKKKPSGIATLMDRFGKNTMYAPKTPEMAPLAPIIGIVDEGSGSA